MEAEAPPELIPEGFDYYAGGHIHEKGEFKSKLTGEEIEKVREVSELLNRVRELINKSICKCHRCARTDQDMKFNPRDKFWYCIECYDEMKKWTAKKKTGKSILFP